MKKMMILCVMILCVLFISCTKQQSVETEKLPVELKLSSIERLYEIEDLRELGIWVFSVEQAVLEGKISDKTVYALKVGEIDYNVKQNPLNREQFIALLPEGVEGETIRNGSLKIAFQTLESSKRVDASISIEAVYIRRSPAENGTALFQISLEDYVNLKKAPNGFVYENGNTSGKLIRPEYIKSSDGYVYTMQYYYDARLVCETHDVNGAFDYLKNHANHETFLFETEPNRVSVSDEGNITVLPPDTRDKVRDLGTMGDISQNHAYDIVSTANGYTLYVAKGELAQKYQSEENFTLDIKGDVLKFTETATEGIFMVNIAEASVSSVDVIKNARFDIGNPFAGGSGTFTDPFHIANADQLNAIRTKYLGAADTRYYFVQIADIDLSNSDYSENWTPLGDATDSFYGSYDGEYEGQPYTISHLVIDVPATHNALFGYTNMATIVNVTLSEASVTGYQSTAGLVGYANTSFINGCSVTGNFYVGYRSGGLVGYSGTTTIDNCSASVTVISPQRGFVGGLVGMCKDATITNSHTKAIVINEGDGYGGYGGFIGHVSSGSYVYNCWTEATVKSNTFWLGGFAGTNYSLIDSCVATVTVNKTDASSDGLNGSYGGFVGGNSGPIRNSYSSGIVVGGLSSGGFVGANGGTTAALLNCYAEVDVSLFEGVSSPLYTGGFVGQSVSEASISNCYALGDVEGKNYTGGFVGQLMMDSTINGCYALGTVSAETYAGGFVGKGFFNVTIQDSYALGNVKANDYAGGFAGDANMMSNYKKCYATGLVEATLTHIGGFTAANSNGSFTDCFWNTETTGCATSVGLADSSGKTTEQMKQANTFTNWDFETVWSIDQDQSYPYLKDNVQEPHPGL